jgi:hypothetical protein
MLRSLRCRLLAAALLTGLHGFSAMNANAANPSVRVLLLHPTDLLMPGTVDVDRLTRDSLSAALDQPLEFYSQGFDEVRGVGPSNEPLTVDLLLRRFALRPPDLIVFHGPMQDVIDRNRNRLWPEVPIMFTGVTDRLLADPAFPKGVPGTTIHFDLRGTVELALKLQPTARRLILVAGTSPYDRGRQQPIPREIEAFRQSLAIEVLNEQTLAQLTQRVASLGADSIVIFISMYRDASNRIYDGRDVVRELAAHSGAPVYVLNPGQIGQGSLGGSV